MIKYPHYSKFFGYSAYFQNQCVHYGTRSKTKNSLEYKSSYSVDEESEIVSSLNSFTEVDIKRFSVSKSIMERILKARESNGKFNKITDLLNVKGVGVHSFENICKDFLRKKDENSPPLQKSKKIVGQILNPSISRSVLENMKTVCAVTVHLHTISWAQMSPNNVVENWDYINLNTQDETKIGLDGLMGTAWSACKQIPQSSIYIMESSPKILRSSGGDTNNPKSVAVNLQKAQLTAMLSATLNTIGNLQEVNRTDELDNNNLPAFNHKVFYLKSSLPSRLFNTFVGNERVSQQSVVDNIFHKPDELSSLAIKVVVPEDLRTRYLDEDAISKEFLSRALLLAMTFMKLCV